VQVAAQRARDVDGVGQVALVGGPAPARAAMSSRGTPNPDSANASRAARSTRSRLRRASACSGRPAFAGEGVSFAGLFADDGVLAYPFAPPGQPRELRGREAIRDFHDVPGRRELLRMDGVSAVVRETGDPEMVVTEITHHGWSRAADTPYEFTALRR
jgi:hypothetical protein